MSRRRRTWRRIKGGSNYKFTFFCWCEISCAEFSKANIQFLRAMEESEEITTMKITLVSLVL